MIKSRTYNTVPGAFSLSHPSLFAVKILSVDRSGTGQHQVNPFITPTDMQFNYLITKITFDSSIPFNAGETVTVIYET